MKITLLEPLGVNQDKIERFAATIREKGHEFISYGDRNENPEELIKRTGNSDAVILTNMPYRAEVIAKCPGLKYISIAFTGVDHVDMEKCREKGILVTNASGYSDIAVAELAYGMILSLSRYLVSCDTAVRNGKTKAGLIGTELYGKTLGVIGCGRIGSRVIEIARSFGCNILAYSRTEKQELADKGIKFVSLETLMTESDIVTLHLPQTPTTVGLINEKLIGLMKPTAILINTARGPIVDSAALAKALDEGRIAGAGVDVYETEPPIAANHPLLNCKNILLAPHVAFATKEALERRADIVFENVLAWLEGNTKNKVV